MRFDVLGPLRVTGPAGPVKVPAGGCAKAVCWLVANVNQPVSHASLAAAIWPAGAADPTKVTPLLRTLAPLLGDALSVGDGAAISVAADQVDAVRFETLVEDGLGQLAAGDLATAEAHLGAALDLWRGDPYPELERALVAMATIDGLVERRLLAQEELLGIALRRPVGYPLVAELRGLVIRHPDRVRLREQLAIALYRTGRQVEALETVAEARQRWVGEPSLGRLHAALLQQSPALADGESAAR